MPVFYYDPITAFQELSATIPEGQRFVQTGIDYEGKLTKYVSDIYPDYPFSDGDADAMCLEQGGMANCSVLTDIMGYAGSTRNPYTVENGVYPYGLSPNGLYLVACSQDYKKVWVAIDSQVPVDAKGRPLYARPREKTRGFFAMLYEKAAVTLHSGKYSTSTYIINTFQGWFPRVNYSVAAFDDILNVFELGGYGFGGIRTGVLPMPIGLVADHDFAVLDALRITDPDGTNHELVLLANPWSALSGKDYVSPYSDDSPFWDAHPEALAYVQKSRPDTGCFWIAWAELRNGQICAPFSPRWFVPLPLATHPHEEVVDYTFTDGTVTTGRWNGEWPEPFQLRPVAIANNDLMTITVTEPTEFRFTMKWNDKSTVGRHGYVAIALPGEDWACTDYVRGWHGSASLKICTLPAGTYEFYVASVYQPRDRGTAQVLIQADKPFEFARGLGNLF
jgi:hypothetical protein